MKEILELALAVCILVGVFLLTQRIVMWRLQRACRWVLKDLESKGALASDSAVPLPYARKDLLRIGVRDYRPKAVEALVLNGRVGMTEEGTYYLFQEGSGNDSV